MLVLSVIFCKCSVLQKLGPTPDKYSWSWQIYHYYFRLGLFMKRTQNHYLLFTKKGKANEDTITYATYTLILNSLRIY